MTVVASLFIACLVIFLITVLFFDDGFGGPHFVVMWFTTNSMFVLGVIMAIDILSDISIKVST